MKSVVCFGDSNTYGHNPVNGERLPESVRWPCLLQELLGGDYKIIEEGLNGRTTVFDDPNDDWKNGIDYIKGILCTHRPVDYLIIMLGTNDMKTIYNAKPEDIAAGLNEIVQRAEKVMDLKQGYIPKILIVSPPEISEDILTGPFAGSFDRVSIDKSRRLSEFYKKVADKHGCGFLDAKLYIKPSKEDGLHLDPAGHKGLAEIIAKTVPTL
ncbi:SGNH/GDSL hydrolase family protein [Butyrivibrio sp. AE2032]|uniref:SGNH/GDSL hydrolase family protein n=1 Tax=Butyrivibrio sp. AE2032 TaxID=1458463 RepID=UPI0005533CDD|nr:SGNH/GDSL hydrolase family protein [Butyrivibrio sp. AE2032]